MGRVGQKFLESIRGLIEDATRDTALWCQANPSEEERAHVLAMQERLAHLDRIITRRVEHRSSPNDGRQWSETVAEVLSRLDKAKEGRGNIVGKGLARLVDHLPKKLFNAKVPPPVRPVSTALTSFSITQAPAPPKEVGGLGVTHARDSKVSQVPHDPPTYFPNDLWPQTNVILLEAQRKFPLQTQALELSKHVTSEMTPLFCRAVKDGKMIDYSNFGELGEIVKSNWDDFDAIFSSLKAFTKIMTALNSLRAPIAHCCPLAEDEVARLRLTVKDWFRLME